jgi:hypothetical protein
MFSGMVMLEKFRTSLRCNSLAILEAFFGSMKINWFVGKWLEQCCIAGSNSSVKQRFVDGIETP